MHWAERTAANLSHRGDTHLVAAGITPSGEFHIGHIREIQIPTKYNLNQYT